MQCYVYKGANRDDHYLYLSSELSNADVPTALLTMLGDLSLVVEFQLHAQRELPQADAEQVMRDIEEQGFYLQMPRKDMRAEEDRLFS
ncbi:MAG: YcgL domain-containing protein [Pseudomonadota bacterium]